ncbi:hypothetical protein LO771_27625 [Streptacidiphilus sp. ASG 303]|uniref:hypothetical protein n=1 Tax=Streptacidiphilus sp. ASG 303 TaxID=2896847 RepID=UPI001E5A2789|nr:hypothetical protein [Streptacidiphilus sp. ASG 303]MCD0486054.1 hypothetical protein [Streptacidiphilus sp. ASG 303]
MRRLRAQAPDTVVEGGTVIVACLSGRPRRAVVVPEDGRTGAGAVVFAVVFLAVFAAGALGVGAVGCTAAHGAEVVVGTSTSPWGDVGTVSPGSVDLGP